MTSQPANGGVSLPDPQGVKPVVPVINEIMTQFLLSAESNLEELETAALALESSPNDQDSLRTALGILHTLKGETGLLGLAPAAEVCHLAEDHIAKLLGKNECPTDFILSIKDWLQVLAESLASNLESSDTDNCMDHTPVSKPATPQPAPAPTYQTPEEGKLRFLIVEDSPVNQMVLECFLSEIGSCVIANNGREGLDRFLESYEIGRPFDLICLDIMMPEMSGQELLSAIRDEEAKREIHGLDGVKIIMTTALSDKKNILTAFRSQCEAYIVKPVAKGKLFEEIKKLGIDIPE